MEISTAYFYSTYLQLPDWYLMSLVLLKYLHFICIFMDPIKSESLTLTYQSHWEDLSSYQTITRLLQSQGLKKIPFTPLATTVYLSHSLFHIPSHNLSSNRFPKFIRNNGCFIFFFTRCWNRKWDSYSHQYEISFPDRYWWHKLLMKP